MVKDQKCLICKEWISKGEGRSLIYNANFYPKLSI